MKNTAKILGWMFLVAGIAIPAYGIEGSLTAVPAKSLADFQNDYAGTKPIIAWHKYQEFLSLKEAPRPTLGVSQMRVTPRESTVENMAIGTKPVAGFLRFEESKREKARLAENPMTVFRPYVRPESGKAAVDNRF